MGHKYRIVINMRDRKTGKKTFFDAYDVRCSSFYEAYLHVIDKYFRGPAYKVLSEYPISISRGLREFGVAEGLDYTFHIYIKKIY